MKVCPKCKKEKENNDFYNDKRRKDKLSFWCKQCKKEEIHYYTKTSESYRLAKAKSVKKYRTITFVNNRTKLFKIMGNKCICCGVIEWWNLTIDHIIPLNGKKRIVTPTLYRKLLDNPEEIKYYQLMCCGCNYSKHTGEKCTINHNA